MPRFRMYVDEVGNADYKASQGEHRYLSLTGVIVETQHVYGQLVVALDELKARYFPTHSPDEPVILHRREVMYARPPFEVLQDPKTRAAFDDDLISLLRDLDCKLITVVIDKRAMKDKYLVWQQHPYHYCLEVLLERYARDLTDCGDVGDVLAEARGRKEDKQLKNAYRRIVTRGTTFYPGPEHFRCLSSKELKLKTKQYNVTGLQVADLIAYPSYRAVRAGRNHEALPGDFNGRVIAAIRDKYRHGQHGLVWGLGWKWLP